ncbi:hypothetical protein JN10_1096 [Altererythrobacter ishigakiensis]|uniref:Uncharacterized protein n=1 Tax=Altererythrobacter ishigakiensis TaxID=476157 RepID=A0A562UV22_9SPHN|nr:hypothetical protein JN10_1096 [Altererythrobacter ishigakiensis]
MRSRAPTLCLGASKGGVASLAAQTQGGLTGSYNEAAIPPRSDLFAALNVLAEFVVAVPRIQVLKIGRV